MTDHLTVQDPRQQYALPPCPEQQQPFPGLDAKMQPLADHGETSYVGAGKLTGRRALITGGDSGIGRAVAIAYAREGADVAINYLPAEESDAQDVKKYIEAAGRQAVLIPGDITDQKFCAEMVARAAAGLGGLDILVSNAARMQSRPSLDEMTDEDFDRTVKTNIYAMHWIIKAAVPHLRPGAAIITTSSVQAYHPSPDLLDYAMTKAAIVNYTKGLAKQLIEKGIRANVVAPGPFWTPLQPSSGYPPEKIANMGKDTGYGRTGQPVELSAVYVLLASQAASFITGEVYGVTGGMGIA